MSARILKPAPDLSREKRLWRKGLVRVAGLDEVGRGAWAGPLAAAAVILPNEKPALLRARLALVRDSKKMTPLARETASAIIYQVASACSIGVASSAEVDQYGPVVATRLAMRRALQGLPFPPDHLLIDFLTLPEETIPQLSFPFGDNLSLSIAAASVIAKVWRDAYMCDLDHTVPGYGFAVHKGYGTALHAKALNRLGVSAHHRISYAPVRRVAGRRQKTKPV